MYIAMHRHKYNIATVYSYLVNKLFSLITDDVDRCTLSAINLAYILLATDTADLSFSGTALTYLQNCLPL